MALTHELVPLGRSMLIARGLAKRYGGVTALRDVSLNAEPGQVHAVVGENGAGKSTLVKILAGLVKPDHGEVAFGGSRIKVAYQEGSLLANLTVAENLTFDQPQRSRRRREAAARRLLDAAEAPPVDVGTQVSDLSLPMRQVIEVVRAAGEKPDVLVLDEANSGLVGTLNDWFLAIARTAADSGTLVLLITHRLAEVRAVADRITVLRGGVSVLQTSPGDVTNDDLIEAMVGHRVSDPIKRAMPAARTTAGVQVRGLRPNGTTISADFDIAEGEIVGLAGLEGNGQKEIISAMGGALRHRGAITVRGIRHTARNPADAIAQGVALVPADRQSEGLLSMWSIQDNITLSCLQEFATRTHLIDRRAAARAAGAAAARLQLPAMRLGAPVSSLSGGNQQRVILARALLTRPKLLLLYDGTRGVDVATRAGILNLLGDLAASGTSVLFYSSDLSEYAQIAHRVLVMSAGHIVGSIRDSRVTEEEILRIAVEAERRSA